MEILSVEDLNFDEDKSDASIKAEKLFMQQAIEHGLIVEKLSQDKESFTPYALGSKGKSLKRGDFLLRNVQNVEVEVKCLTLYQDEKQHPRFYIGYHQLKKHENMQAISGASVLLAIYERDGASPKVDSLRMIRISTLLSLDPSLKFYDSRTKCIVFSDSLMHLGFSLVDELKLGGNPPSN